MRTRTALLACLVGLAPALALGQTAGTVTFTETSTTSQGGLSDGTINIAECQGTIADSLTLQWALLAVPPGGQFYRIFVGTSTCATSGNVPAGSSSSLVEITNGFQALGTSQTGSWTTAIPVRSLTSVLASACNVATSLYVCVYVADTNGATPAINTLYTASGSIGIDVTTPGQPTSVSALSGDGALTAGWVAGSGTATTWVATATPAPADATVPCNAGGVAGSATCSGSSTTSCRITGLTNNACYNVTVQGFTASNNPSQVSAAAAGVPRPVDDFWQLYQQDGGREQGGCAGGPAAALSLLALAALAPRLRRRRP